MVTARFPTSFSPSSLLLWLRVSTRRRDFNGREWGCGRFDEREEGERDCDGPDWFECSWIRLVVFISLYLARRLAKDCLHTDQADAQPTAANISLAVTMAAPSSDSSSGPEGGYSSFAPSQWSTQEMQYRGHAGGFLSELGEYKGWLVRKAPSDWLQ
ncbi:hypothetical protein BKA70DRAFT_466310 [Coprinopsis sp. MPI-PUGE-AT-0042]|nr:hypothetical protein BKA70DRAFT_466310 [Coprinopsis sp. MPI-PUGE-AT-0042]